MLSKKIECMYTRDIIGQPSNRSFQTYKRKPLKKRWEKKQKQNPRDILKKTITTLFVSLCSLIKTT